MSTMIIVEDRTRGEAIKQKLWYSGEDVDQFKVEATQISHMLRRFFSCKEDSRDDDQVSTRADYSGASIDLEEISIDYFLGLEKRLTGEYYPRRQLLSWKNIYGNVYAQKLDAPSMMKKLQGLPPLLRSIRNGHVKEHMPLHSYYSKICYTRTVSRATDMLPNFVPILKDESRRSDPFTHLGRPRRTTSFRD